MVRIADAARAESLPRVAAWVALLGVCLGGAGCSMFERQVMAPPSATNPMTEPPSGLMDPCAGLTLAQRAATQGCATH